ncbi:serine/threonine-protein kinase [Tautonia plasticadhaerens]|nr:serine/threonine-protein kinase [Tautonia plasticadhaerens]
MNTTHYPASRDYGRFDELAEEFAARYRRGERPSLQEYIDRCPELAEEIRGMFPALVEVEQAELDVHRAADPATPPGRPAPAQLGDFRILREIGHGGMGVVYEAEQVSLGRHVALKLLPPQGTRDPDQRRRFEREARAAARLHHTNIVPVFGVGEHAGTPYYAMQFIRGSGLDKVLDELKRLHDGTPASTVNAAGRGAPRRDAPAAAVARSLWTGRFEPGGTGGESVPDGSADGRGPIDVPVRTEAEPISSPTSPDDSRPSGTPALSSSSVLLGQGEGTSPRSRKPTYGEAVARIGVQVADALDYAHAQGILHRDIKPSNLLLDARGTVWVTDFGLAKADDQQDLTHTGDLLGTLRYMPPEAFEGKSGARGDVYALGMTLYELLAFRPAFEEKERGRLIRQVTTEEPERLGRLNPEVPRDLATIVHKAIHKEPARRYASAGELAADLRRYLSREPIQARSVGALERAWIWARRRPTAAALLLISGVAVVALGMVVTGLVYNARLKVAKDLAEVARMDAERYRYFHHIALAQAAWNDGNLGRARQLLDDCPRDQRGWEWYCIDRLRHGALLTLTGHNGFPGRNSVAFSPDGTLLAAACDDLVTLSDARTGRLLQSLTGHSGQVYSVTFGPDGNRLVSVGEDQTLRVWDVATGREVRPPIRVPGGVLLTVAFSPDGNRIAAGGETLMVWEAATGQHVRTLPGHTAGVRTVVFSPDGTLIASIGGDGFAKLWDTTNYRELHPALKAAKGRGFTVAFSPDGSRLATGGTDRAVIWDVTTGSEVFVLPDHDNASDLAFSPDGRWLVTGGRGRVVRVWDLTTRQVARTFRGHTHEVTCIAFSPDGGRLVSASVDGTVNVWDMMTDQEPRPFAGHADWATCVAFSPDGTLLASTSRGSNTVKVWDTTTGQLRFAPEGHSDEVWGVAFSPDGALLASASADRTVRLWDAATGQWRWTLSGHTAGVSRVTFSPDGRRIASTTGAFDDRIGPAEVKIWDVNGLRDTRTLSGLMTPVLGLAFTPDGTRLAAASLSDGTIVVWDTRTGKVDLTLPGHTGGSYPLGTQSVTFSPDGSRIASGGWDNTVKIWDARTGGLLDTLRGHYAQVTAVAFSPAGARLASASGEQAVKIWDVQTGQEALTLRGYSSFVYTLAFSPDGTRLAAGCGDGTLRTWDARPWTPEAAIEREAVGLLDSLFARPLCKADVISYLQDTPTIRPRARDLALSLVDRYHEETDPESYHRASWALVRQPYLNAFQYRFALLQAEHAYRLAEDQASYRTTLGAARCRAGLYQEAVATLTRADRLVEDSPAGLAFLAMARQRLGQGDEARAALGRLRELVARPGRTEDAEMRDLLHETEALLDVPAEATRP